MGIDREPCACQRWQTVSAELAPNDAAIPRTVAPILNRGVE